MPIDQCLDVQTVEKHLLDDFSTLIRNLKIREERYAELMQYNKANMPTNQENESLTLFTHNINKHRNYLQKISEDERIMAEQEFCILERYNGIAMKDQSVMKLMGRVGARILEMCQSAYEKRKGASYNETGRYIRLKNSLIRHLNPKKQLELGEITKCVIQYAHGMLNSELNFLRHIALRHQHYQQSSAALCLQKVIIPHHTRQQINNLNYQHTQKAIPISHTVSLTEEKKLKTQNIIKEQRTLRSLPKKESTQKVQKIDKEKNKAVVNVYSSIYGPMDLSKAQFMENMIYQNAQQKYSELYREMMNRNKANQLQIRNFQAKRKQYHAKIAAFKEIMSKENLKIQETLFKKPRIHRIEHKEGICPYSSNRHNPEENIASKQAQAFTTIYSMSSSHPVSHSNHLVSPKNFSPQHIMYPVSNAVYTNFSNPKINANSEYYTQLKCDTINKDSLLRGSRKLPHIAHNNKSNLSSSSNQQSEQLTEALAVKRELKDKKQKAQRTSIAMSNVNVGSGIQGCFQSQSKNCHQDKTRKFRELYLTPMGYTFYFRKKNHLKKCLNDILF